MGIPAKFSTLVTRVSVTTLLARGATPSQASVCTVISKCLPQKCFPPPAPFLKDGVDRDSRHGSDRRTGAASDRGRALARAHAARRARSARGKAAPRRERALHACLSARDRWPRASRSFCDVGGDQPVKILSIRSTARSQSKAVVTSF